MEARRLPLGASPTQVAIMRPGKTSMPVSSYSSRMAPSSRLSPGWRRPAGGSQVPVGRRSRSRRPSSRTGRIPETRSAFKASPQTRCRLYPPHGKYMIRRGGSRTAPTGHLRAVREPPALRGNTPGQPGEHVQASGEVEYGPGLRRLQSYLLRHREPLDLDLRRLERPQTVVDLAATNDAFLVGAVQTITLGKKVLDGAMVALKRLSHGPITGHELRRSGTPVRADAPVVDFVVYCVAGHVGVEVGQAEGGTGEPDGQAAVGVQGEEPDAGPVLCRDVGAEVDFGEVRESGNGGQKMGPHAGHVEGHDTQPGAPVEGVDAQRGRHERPEHLRIDGPMHEEQVPPRHPHRPRAGRNRVGPVPHLV